MTPALPFPELLKIEISQLQEKLERNPTYIRLRAAERTLEAYGEGQKIRAEHRPNCKCGRAFTAHLKGGFCDKTKTRAYEAVS